MANPVQEIILALKQLTSAEYDVAAPSGWMERLQYNLIKSRKILASQSHVVTEIKSEYQLHSISLTSSNDHALWDFVTEGLALLICLYKVLDTSLQDDTSNSTPPLLSISDQKCIESLLQFISLLGIYLYLDQGVGLSFAAMSSHTNISITKSNELSGSRRAWHLGRTLHVLMKCMGDETLAQLILSTVLTNILAAMIQIIYKPEDNASNSSSSDIKGVSPFDLDSTLLANEREWCISQLHHLLDIIPQSLAVRELLVLQGTPSRVGTRESRGKNNDLAWLHRACGNLLSERLMQKNGVQAVLRGLFETTSGGATVEDSSDNWRKCYTIAKIIAKSPAQVSSVDHYYSIICPQILSLFHLPHEVSGRQFLRVAVSTLSIMLSRQYELARKYLTDPLLHPLRQLAGECEFDVPQLKLLPAALKTCIVNLHRIVLVVEPTSPFMVFLCPYLPILFEVWRVSSKAKQLSMTSQQTKEVIVHVFQQSEISTQMGFLNHLLHLDLPSSLSFTFKSLSNCLLLICDDINRELIVKDNDSSELYSSQLMEDIGSSVVELLTGDLKNTAIFGPFFVSCLQQLSFLLSRECGLKKSDMHRRQKLLIKDEDPQTMKQQESKITSTVLLDWEEETSTYSERQNFSNTLVLYVIAALCESMDKNVLEELDKPVLLETLLSIVQCHSHCISDNSGVLITTEDHSLLYKLTGGHVTLGIAFGLLSATLAGSQQVDCKLRPILMDLLPYLVIISQSYPDSDLSSLADDLRVCISTLGAVWSAEMKERAQNITGQLKQKSELEKTASTDKNKDSTVTKHDTNCPVLIEEICSESSQMQQPSSSETHTDNNKQDSTTTPYQQALFHLQDPLLPVQGHGLKQLTDLIKSRDDNTLNHINKIIAIFKENLYHTDSYIYLAAIQGFVSLVSVCPQEVLPLLCREYAQFNEPDSKIKSEKHTGIYRTHSERETSHAKHKISTERSLQWRIKLGEALVQAARDCGDMLPHYSQILLSAVLSNVQSSDPLLRASALSNLADICCLLKWSFLAIENEVLTCLQDILTSDSDPSVRCAALIVIKELFKGLKDQTVQVLGGDYLLQLYRLLKKIESTDPDQLTQTHAQAALGMLDSIMREILFPPQSLTKKISILDPL